MSREIEFRAWLKDEKKMINVKAIDWDEDGNIFSINYPEGKSYSGYGSDNIELMQYTNIKDKNGVKIFEGDVVEIFYNFENEYFEEKTLHSRGVIKFDKGMFTVKFEGYDYYINADGLILEVIGNIYENPELLEVEDE